MSIINFKDLVSLKYNLAPSQLVVFDIPNKNTFSVKDLLDRKLKFSDNGNEVGSSNYISKSTHFFIKAKALQSDFFIPDINSESVNLIRPQVFSNYNLTENDLIISKDSNIGEAVILDKDYSNFMISGALYKLPITKNKYYLFAFLKHNYFKSQLDLLVPKGSTIRHAKTLFLDCKIPFPNQKDSIKIIEYVESLVKSIINKEKEIKSKNEVIFDKIEKEMFENQKMDKLNNYFTNFNLIKNNTRFDAGYYCEDYFQKKSLIENYIYGAKTLEEWKFNIKRGQNLQVSQIGKSIYSNKIKENFYVLVRPTNFSEYGTINRFEYLGNPNKLTNLEVGDIVFSGEGTIGKCVLFIDPKDKWITNIHGIILNKKDHNIVESAFVSCFLRFLRKVGLLDYISVGGQGGSLAKKYWKDVLIPNFPKIKQKEIADLYYNNLKYPENLNLETFLSEDEKWTKKAGILDLDKSIKKTKKHLNKILDKIINDEKVIIDFKDIS